MWIATAQESREIDRHSQDEFGISTSSLMEGAGRALCDAARMMLPKGRVAVVCGRGNNGGDGLVAARLLREIGYAVRCVIASSEPLLSPATTDQLAHMRQFGLNPMLTPDGTAFDAEIMSGCDLVIDALLGTGATGEVTGPVRDAIQAINEIGMPVLSADLPSGIEADTGHSLGIHVRANQTAVFGLPKPCLFQGDGQEASGKWTVHDIGIPPKLMGPTAALLLERELVADNLPIRSPRAHKGMTGHVLVVAGSKAMPGAAVLAAKGALRAGAGLVTVASVSEVCESVARHLPEALLLPLAGVDGAIGPDALEALKRAQANVDVALFGPGLTANDSVIELFRGLWPEWEKPCVIDADAINAAAGGDIPYPLRCALTPHSGELGRILKSSAEEVEKDRFASVRKASSDLGHAVLLKGSKTLIASTGLPTAVNPTGNSGLATGGSGDVLGGIAATLLSQGMAPYDALACAAYWHGAAADICAELIGPVGYSPSEVADKLPRSRAIICGTN